MADVRKLRQDALDAASKGNWRKAAWCYANLEKDDPGDPSWSLRLGETLRKLGNDAEAVKALSRAARAYGQSGVLLKAIAVCKLIVAIDPKHAAAQQMLESFHASVHGSRAGRAPEPASQGGGAVPTSAPRGPEPPLARLRLAELVPGARQSSRIPSAGSSAAMEIPIDDDFAEAPGGGPKQPGPETMAQFVLPKTPFFTVLSPGLLRMAVERVRLVSLPAGQALFRRGEAGDALYVVAWGEVSVQVPEEVARLSEGEFFGEIALLTNRPRTATVSATVDSQVLAIDRPLLGDLIAASPDLLKVLLRFLRERLIATLSATSPLFAPFTPLERLGLAARFQVVEIDRGLAIVEEGKRSPGLFILLAGEAVATRGGKPIARLECGDIFGEMSLMMGGPATASVIATSNSFVLFLPRSSFNELIMTHPQVLEQISAIIHARTSGQAAPVRGADGAGGLGQEGAPAEPIERVALL